eukprot:5299617-Pleurochrysis_carterae.AAC.1
MPVSTERPVGSDPHMLMVIRGPLGCCEQRGFGYTLKLWSMLLVLEGCRCTMDHTCVPRFAAASRISVCKPRLALLLESSDKSLQELIQQQQSQIGSGDQPSVISRKLQSFRAQLKPLTEAMEEAKMLRKLDANKPTKAIVAAA